MVDNIIKLFDSEETSFESNGIGILADTESCLVTEERNGEFELEMIYPLNGRYFSEIALRRIVVTKSNPYSNPQPFRIYSISKPFDGKVTINAEHISYDLSGYPVAPFTASDISSTFINMKEACAVDCPFTFSTNKTVTSDFELTVPSSMRSLLAGSTGSILDVYSTGEYEFDGYKVNLWLNRGNNYGVTIRYGKNLTDIEQEEVCDNVYTGVYPYWYSETDDVLVTLVGYEESSDSDDEESEDDDNYTVENGVVHANTGYEFTRILTLDLTSKFDSKPSQADLLSAAKSYIKDNDITTPTISIDISFQQLSKTSDYENYAALEEIKLCDTVTVEYPDLGVSATAKCVKTVYDALKDEYDEIELGSAKSNIANTLSEQSKTISESASKSYVDIALDEASDLITGNSGGYVIIHSSTGGKTPDEILIMDTDDLTTAQNIWRWNKSGLAHFSEGYNSTANVAITQEGEINANFITVGTLTAIALRSEVLKDDDGNEYSLFSVTSDGTLKALNATIEGTVTATAGVIGGCEIQNGLLQVPAANITGTLTASQIDAANLKVDAANINGTLTIGQLPDDVATTSDIPTIPTNISAFTNDSGYQTETGVTTIVNGVVTTDYVNALGITVDAANINGLLTADQIDVTNLTVDVANVTGKLLLYDTTYGDVSDVESSEYGFSVDSKGLLKASNAMLGGTIYANAGQIAGFVIDSSDTAGTVFNVIEPTDGSYNIMSLTCDTAGSSTSQSISIDNDHSITVRVGKLETYYPWYGMRFTKSSSLTDYRVDIVCTYTYANSSGNADMITDVVTVTIAAGSTSKSVYKVISSYTPAWVTGNVRQIIVYAPNKYISCVKEKYDDDNYGVYLGTDGIGVGNGTFYVDNFGALVSESAYIKGDIEGNSIVTTNFCADKANFGGLTALNGKISSSYNSTAIDMTSMSDELVKIYFRQISFGLTKNAVTAELKIGSYADSSGSSALVSINPVSLNVTFTVKNSITDKTSTRTQLVVFPSGVSEYEVTISISGGFTVISTDVETQILTASSGLSYAYQANDSIHGQIVITGDLVPNEHLGYYLGASGSYWKNVYYGSDRKFKANIEDVDANVAINFIKALKPKIYEFTNDPNKKCYGLIAQDVEDALLSVGVDSSKCSIITKTHPMEPDSEENYYGLSYSSFISPIIKVLQVLCSTLV
ncbi:MAG: phage tail protein [Clostridia bacterium]|nr:phage tail protein [Clostridia bacterium]